MKSSTLIGTYLTKNHRLSWSAQELTKRAFKYLVDALGDMEIAEIHYAEVEDYQSWLISERGLRPVSANSYIKTASPVFSWAVRRRLIQTNPFTELQLFRVKTKLRVYSEAETQAILAAAHNDMWRARIMAALSAGLRRGEICNLTWDDIDAEQMIIHVQDKEDTALTWPWSAKNRQARDVPLVGELHNLLVKMMMELPAGLVYPFLTEKRQWSLLQRKSIPERIRVCPDENWTRPFQNIMRRAKVKKGTFHDLRRTCLKRWSEAGLPAEDLRQLAGHSDLKTTLEYYLPVGRDYLNKARLISSTR